MTELKLFGRYTVSDVEVKCISLKPYINFGKPMIIPHASNTETFVPMGNKYASIIERLANSFMRSGRNTGKKMKAIKIVEHALYIIEVVTGQHPLQVLADAILNAGPREESARIGRSGNMKRMSIDVSPLRRISKALRSITESVRNSAKRSPKTIGECLADELIACSRNLPNSGAIKKKEEIERIAKSNR